MALRVGLIGCGGIARHHWNGFEKTRGRADLVALCDISAENRAWFKQHVPQAAEYDDFQKLIADGQERVFQAEFCDLRVPIRHL